MKLTDFSNEISFDSNVRIWGYFWEILSLGLHFYWTHFPFVHLKSFRGAKLRRFKSRQKELDERQLWFFE